MTIEWRWEPKKAEAARLAALARQAAAAEPERPHNWVVLANLLARANHDQEALDALLRGIEHCPADAELHYAAALRLSALRRFSEALRRCNEAVQLAPGHPGAQRLQFVLEVQTRDFDAARQHLAAVAAADPCEPSIFKFLGRHMDDEGVAEELLERCAAALAINPGCANAVFFKALVLAKLGRAHEATAALSLDRYLNVSAPHVPEGFADHESFLRKLAREIGSHDTLRPEPSGKATMGGMQTGPLSPGDGPAVAAAINIIRTAVESYACQPDVASSSFAAAAPDACSLDIWAVVLGPDGRQRPHLHPGGWLSGVFYVAAPQAPDGRHSGSLLVGAIKDKFGMTPPWGVREIEPVPGRLVLFPSYTPHATEPSGLPGERISIAFDVNAAA